MLLLKSYSLKNVFTIKIHLLFYCAYFFLRIPFDFLNKIQTQYPKKNKQENIILISFIFLKISLENPKPIEIV